MAKLYARRSHRALVVAAALTAAVLGLWQVSFMCFAVIARAGAAVADRADAGQVDEIDQKQKKKQGKEESLETLKARNFTLEFSSGLPIDTVRGVTNSPPYATCFVEYQDRSQRDFEGTVQPRSILEEWVMRGDGETLDSFKEWRLRDGGDMTFRCLTTTSNSLRDTTCIECVSHSPFSASLAGPGGIVGTVHSSNVMTFNGLPQCLATHGGRMGFCKSGMVAVSL